MTSTEYEAFDADSVTVPATRFGSAGQAYLLFLVAVSSLGGFLFGYDTGELHASALEPLSLHK